MKSKNILTFGYTPGSGTQRSDRSDDGAGKSLLERNMSDKDYLS
jgi:hypothetical protein